MQKNSIFNPGARKLLQDVYVGGFSARALGQPYSFQNASNSSF